MKDVSFPTCISDGLDIFSRCTCSLVVCQQINISPNSTPNSPRLTYRSAVHPCQYIAPFPAAFYDAFFKHKSFAHILLPLMISRSRWDRQLYLAWYPSRISGRISSILKKIANLAGSPDLETEKICPKTRLISTHPVSFKECFLGRATIRNTNLATVRFVSQI